MAGWNSGMKMGYAGDAHIREKQCHRTGSQLESWVKAVLLRSQLKINPRNGQENGLDNINEM